MEPVQSTATRIKPTIKKLTLFSALPPQALLAQQESGFVAEPSNKTVLQNLWQKANQAYRNIGPPSRSYVTQDDIRQLDDADPSRVKGLLDQVRLYGPYDSHPTDLCKVKVSKLVTPQITINLARAGRRARIKQNMATDELLEIMFMSAGQPEPITRQILGLAPNGGAVIFTSYDEDIRLHHPPEYREIPINDKDKLSPSLESVCLPVGGGLPFASAYRIQIAPGVTRLILNNGIHRIYQLASAGYEWGPLLVCDLVPLELPEPFVELPRSILLDPTANPPLITDFLNKDLVIPLNYFTLLKTLRLNWNFEQYVTVLK